jgi:hypothetical protein
MYACLGSLVLRAYPPRVRAARGEEMLGTLLDAGEESGGAFIRGIASLLISGLRERAGENAQVGARRLVADAFCQAAVFWSLLELLSDLRRYPQMPVWSLVLLAGVPVFAILGRDRIGGLCGVAAAAYVLTRGFGTPLSGSEPMPLGHPGFVFFAGRWLGPLICFTVMVVRPRVRVHDPRRVFLLIPVAALVLVSATTTVLIPVTILFLIGLPLAGIIVLPVDPRLAIASALLWADIGVTSNLGRTQLGLITVLAVMVVVLVTIGRGKVLARQTHT